jgi:hypothetical protein
MNCMHRANILGLLFTYVDCLEKCTRDGDTIFDISFYFVFSITFVQNIFCSNKCVERYGRGAPREVYRYSYKIVVKITPSITQWQYPIQFSQSIYLFFSSSYVQTDELMILRRIMYFKLYAYWNYYVSLEQLHDSHACPTIWFFSTELTTVYYSYLHSLYPVVYYDWLRLAVNAITKTIKGN